MAEKKKYQIKIQGQLVPVTEEVYLTYYRMNRRELHLEEQDRKHGVFHYSALDTEDITGEDGIPDRISPPVEDVVADKLLAEKLHQCLAQLTVEEQKLNITGDGNKVAINCEGGIFAGANLGLVKYHFEIGAGKENFEWV